MPQHMGRLLRRFFHPALDFIEDNKEDVNLKELLSLCKGTQRLTKTSMYMAQKGLSNPYEIGAAATDYLRQFGLVAMGYMWLLMLKVAFEKRTWTITMNIKLLLLDSLKEYCLKHYLEQ